MSFKSVPIWLITLIGSALTAPLYASDSTLTLPGGASVGVEVVEELHFSESQSRQNSILLHPLQAERASHKLPEYCVLVANAQVSNERVRITTQDATCIETHNDESAIFSGSFSARAYTQEGQYGLPCTGGNCTLSPGDTFVLTLDEDINIHAQDNPSAEINATRRQADGDGVANPVPAETPNPEASTTPANSAGQAE